MKGEYSDNRRSTAVRKVERVQRFDVSGSQDLKVQRSYERAMKEAAAQKASGNPEPKPDKRSFAALMKKR